MISSKPVNLIVIMYGVFVLALQQIIITCQECPTLCKSGLCAVFNGRRISLNQEQRDKSCIDAASCQGYPINLSPHYCEADTDNLTCSSKCCIGHDRLSFAQRVCTDSLNYTFQPENYCKVIYKNEQGFAFFAGSLVLLMIVIMFSCFVFKRCQPEKTKQQLQAQKDNHIKKPRKLSIGFYKQHILPIFPNKSSQQTSGNLLAANRINQAIMNQESAAPSF